MQRKNAKENVRESINDLQNVKENLNDAVNTIESDRIRREIESDLNAIDRALSNTKDIAQNIENEDKRKHSLS